MKKNIKSMLFNVGHIESVSRCQNGLTVILRHLCRKNSNSHVERSETSPIMQAPPSCHFEGNARKISNNEGNHPMRSFALRLKMTEYNHVEQSETSHGMFTPFKKLIAFSLVELMISLITISCIAAAFTPVITKKLKKQDIALSLAQTSEITNQCSGYEPKFTSKCKLCTKTYCIQCPLENCSKRTYLDTSYCDCKNCSSVEKFETLTKTNCVNCDKDKCYACDNEGVNEGKFYVDNGQCKNCPSDKICNGVDAMDKAVCSTTLGYFCDGNKLRKCSFKYGILCDTCNPTKCLTCTGWYFMNSAGECQGCPYACPDCDNAVTCKNCADGFIKNPEGKCESCGGKIEHCSQCKNYNDITCTACEDGYYLANGKECRACSTISNCLTCNNDGKCTTCQKGYYHDNNGVCRTCSVSNCARCLSNGKCGFCNQNYHVENGNCVADNNEFHCSDSVFMEIPVNNKRLCITRKNMGDDPILSIPSTVITANAGSYCYTEKSKCCWKGTTAGACDSANGDYSGCERTVCAFAAAKEICNNFDYGGKKWRLMTLSEAQAIGTNFINYTRSLGNDGLQLCFHHNGNYEGVARCNYNQGPCKGGSTGAAANRCAPQFVWLENASNFCYENGLGIPSWGSEIANSTRCVTEMDE